MAGHRTRGIILFFFFIQISNARGNSIIRSSAQFQCGILLRVVSIFFPVPRSKYLLHTITSITKKVCSIFSSKRDNKNFWFKK